MNWRLPCSSRFRAHFVTASHLALHVPLLQPAVKSALRLAIELGRTEFVSKLLKLPGIQLGGINMMRLCALAITCCERGTR